MTLIEKIFNDAKNDYRERDNWIRDNQTAGVGPEKKGAKNAAKVVTNRVKRDIENVIDRGEVGKDLRDEEYYEYRDIINDRIDEYLRDPENNEVPSFDDIPDYYWNINPNTGKTLYPSDLRKHLADESLIDWIYELYDRPTQVVANTGVRG